MVGHNGVKKRSTSQAQESSSSSTSTAIVTINDAAGGHFEFFGIPIGWLSQSRDYLQPIRKRDRFKLIRRFELYRFKNKRSAFPLVESVT